MGSRLSKTFNRQEQKESNFSNNSTDSGHDESRDSKLGQRQQKETDQNGNMRAADNSPAEHWQSEKIATCGNGTLLLPLADDRISHTEAINLLAEAKSRALSDLTMAGFVPKVDKMAAFDFPFENAAFEGGGVKGIAYIGALKVGQVKFIYLIIPTCSDWLCNSYAVE